MNTQHALDLAAYRKSYSSSMIPKVKLLKLWKVYFLTCHADVSERVRRGGGEPN